MPWPGWGDQAGGSPGAPWWDSPHSVPRSASAWMLMGSQSVASRVRPRCRLPQEPQAPPGMAGSADRSAT
eukprot:1695058-Alexandrium_andersonii.AAC.1